jgi:hypothetical protein
MTTRVQIQRKRRSAGTKMLAWANFLTLILSWMMRPYIDQERTVVQEAKLELVRNNTRVADMRAAKISNELVLQDMKIEEQKMKLRLLENELKVRGLKGNGFEVKNYPE